MMKRLLAAMALVCILAIPAEARPVACRGIPWCGCWLRLEKGISDPRLNVARNWATLYGRPAAGPCVGCVAVWRHHVGVMTDHGRRAGTAVIKSGNDGGRVRVRERSIHGVIAWRR
jgi:hypothetical protein